MFATVERAIEELQNGKPIIVVDDENRENEGDFLALGRSATADMINLMATEGRGLICVPIDETYAERLALPMMTPTNSDPHGTAFTVSIDHHTTTTGISTMERSQTILSMLNPDAKPTDFNRPGHIFPLIAKSGGVLERPGHTEAAVDLAKLAGVEPVGVICEIMNEDGTMARIDQLKTIAERLNLVILTIADLITYQQKNTAIVERQVAIQLPTDFGTFEVVAFVEKKTGKEHLAFMKGRPKDAGSVLVRLHSECLTGDIFHSNRCDCGEQLEKSLQQIQEEDCGVLLYLRQEGRGIGLINKLKAYALQDQGFDTVEANEQLGFPDDARDYAVAANILQQLDIQTIDLLTNNPRKMTALEHYGIEIRQRVAIECPVKNENAYYMQTKKEKLGHYLHL